MSERGEYHFGIAAFTPLTLSMKRLNEYLADLIDLFAHESNVHFLRVDEGSAKPTIYVEGNAIAKVERRLLAVATKTASGRAMDAYNSLNDKLFDDDTSAELTGREGRILYFPGSEREFSPEIGPLVETGVIEGEVYGIGGRDESIQVYIRDGEKLYTCTTTRERGREIATKHLFQGRVRVHGEGKWKRTKEEIWKLVQFEIGSVESLKTDKLSDVVGRLRSIETPELDKIQDPLAYLADIR